MLKHVVPVQDGTWSTLPTGQRLGGSKSHSQVSQNITKTSSISGKENDKNATLPLRLPIGQLYFGYDVPSLNEAKADGKEETNAFTGSGNILRSKKGIKTISVV
jgi:hypothetical protein